MPITSASPTGPATGITPVRIAVVGSLHMDFINFVEQHSAANGHVRSKRELRVPGGHGANQAVACARLSGLPRNYLMHKTSQSNESSRPRSGIEVSMFGAVGGQDLFGKQIQDELKQNKVNIDHIVTIKGGWTGYAHVDVSDDGSFHVTHSPGASKNYLPGPYGLKDSFRPHVVLVQLEIEETMVLHALKWAKKHNAMTICNAAPATRTVSHEIFKVDHFIVNEQQADALNGMYEAPYPPEDRINQPAVIRQHYLELCKLFHQRGAACVVITMAELGVVGSSVDQVSGPAIRQQYIFDAEQGSDPVKDTTGAADAFIGGYTVGLVHQKEDGLRQDMASAMQLGIKAAGLSISREGSMRATPTPELIMNTKFRPAGNEIVKSENVNNVK